MKIDIKSKDKESDNKGIISKDWIILVNNNNTEHNQKVIFIQIIKSKCVT